MEQGSPRFMSTTRVFSPPRNAQAESTDARAELDWAAGGMGGRLCKTQKFGTRLSF